MSYEVNAYRRMEDKPHEHSEYFNVSEDIEGPMICSILSIPPLGKGHMISSKTSSNKINTFKRSAGNLGADSRAFRKWLPYPISGML